MTRYELVLDVTDDGHISQVGWTVHDSTDQLVALGCHPFGDVTAYSRIEALALGIIFADQNVEMNGGLQVELPF